MPYVICSSCKTTAYTAARFTTVDDCPLCGERLRRANAQPLRMDAQWAVAAAGGAGGGETRAQRAAVPE